eukprot:NODE_3304_length_1002_cov_11.160546_g3038_i0.p1 GENE.NODE_3304_length_1002_cov_11.160546_g3038_i0~~NODE_3304_length_1002_cov_11.160546_g3038_i0.p1  ORF type:complete len:276 (-),score=70.30 NODE_3304_length_1002_cov_11.160546_g3038_i0:174-911(-)
MAAETSQRLSPSALQKMVERLTRPPREKKEEVGPEAPKMKPEAMQSFYERNYFQQVKKMKKKHDEDMLFLQVAVAKGNPLLSPKKKSSQEPGFVIVGAGESQKKVPMEQWVESHYAAPRMRREANLRNLEQKFMAPIAASKQIPQEVADAASERLYKKSMEHKSQTLEVAATKVYGAPTPPKRLTAAEREEQIQKLYFKAREKQKAAQEAESIEHSRIQHRKHAQRSKELPAHLQAVVERLSTKG